MIKLLSYHHSLITTTKCDKSKIQKMWKGNKNSFTAYCNYAFVVDYPFEILFHLSFHAANRCR